MSEFILGIPVTDLDLDIGSVATRQGKNISRAPLVAALLSEVVLLLSGCAPYIDHSRGGLSFYFDTPENRATVTANLERAQRRLEQKQIEQEADADIVRWFMKRRLNPKISPFFIHGNSTFSIDDHPRHADYDFNPYFEGVKFPPEAKFFRLWEIEGNTLAGPGKVISLKGVTVYNGEGKEIFFETRVEPIKTFNNGVIPEADWLIDTSIRPARVAGEDLQSFAKSVVKIPEGIVWRTQWKPVWETRSANGGYKEYERSENTTFVSADETVVTVTSTTKGEVILTEQRP